MAITTQAGLIAAMEAAEQVIFLKTGILNTAGAGIWNTSFSTAGNPAAGTLAGASTAAGVVPDDTTTGCPSIRDFAGGKTGYLASVCVNLPKPTNDFSGCRVRVSDLLFKAGAYSFNSNVTLASQPSYSSRIPGADYKGTEIWIEVVTAMTGALTVTITYTNQDGTTGKSTSLALASGAAATRMAQVPLASGDTGVQKIESVVGSVATVGTFNVLVLRPLWCARVYELQELFHGPDLTDLPVLFGNSALFLQTQTVNGQTMDAGMDLVFGIVNG